MKAREIQVELLLGRQVVSEDSTPVGRIEEICAEERQGELVVTEYLLGAYALLERLSASLVVRGFLNFLGLRTGYRVPWDKLDLTDVKCPRLTCSLSEVKMLPPDSRRWPLLYRRGRGPDKPSIVQRMLRSASFAMRLRSYALSLSGCTSAVQAVPPRAAGR
jgi:hypothetical protein